MPRVRQILGPAAEAQQGAGRGLIFAMDATASRQPTWDRAIEVQASMFSAFSAGLKVQLVYFRGSEFYASPWSRKPGELAAVMRGVACIGGLTQIGYVLSHAERAAAFGKVSALVYVGDSMEEEQEELASLARQAWQAPGRRLHVSGGYRPRRCGVLPRDRQTHQRRLFAPRRSLSQRAEGAADGGGGLRVGGESQSRPPGRASGRQRAFC